MATDEITDALASFSLFADLSGADLQAISHTFEEESFAEGQRILRQNFGGTGFYLILQGEAAVVIDGEERSRLSRGDFFGEISILLGEPPSADVIALTQPRATQKSLEFLITAAPGVPASSPSEDDSPREVARSSAPVGATMGVVAAEVSCMGSGKFPVNQHPQTGPSIRR